MTRDGRPKPVIGLSVGFHDFGDYQGVGFQRPIALAGGLPLTLPRLPEVMDDLLDHLDGLVVGGGRDIDPARYGQEPHERLAATDPHRDAFELELVPRALERGLPLLGMCRGIQILNVALGGTLVQDLALVEAWAGHPSDPGWRRWREVERTSLAGEPGVPAHPRHRISIEPGTRLHEALRTESAEVSSFHHQALDRLGAGLRPAATADDGVVEAVELEGEAWVVGVQWEQQEEWRADSRFLELYRRLVTAAASGREAPAADRTAGGALR